MFTVYVLYSVKFDKTYTGHTSDLPSRLLSHNALATKGFTVKYRPWIVIYSEELPSKSEAIKREQYFKSGRGRAFVRSLIKEKYS